MYDRLLRTIETLYDCVGDDFDRDRALEAYSRLADDSPVLLADMNPPLKLASRHNCFNIADDVFQFLTSRYECPVRDKFFKTFGTLPVCTPILRRTFISDDVWLTSKMREIGLKPWGLHSEGAATISKGTLNTTFCFFSRHADQKPLDVETLSAMAIVNRHLHRAMTVQRRIDKLEEVLIQSSNVLDLIDFGLVLYGAARSPIFVNAAAHRIFDANDGISLQKSGPAIEDTKASELFHSLLDAIFRPNISPSASVGGIVKISRRSGSNPYGLMVVPLRHRNVDMESVSAAVFMFDPSARKTTAIEMFISSYGLTRSEAELAHCLVLGNSLDEAAMQRGVSRNTAKSQLHSIFGKTDTKRQPELVSLLLRSVSGINLQSEKSSGAVGIRKI